MEIRLVGETLKIQSYVAPGAIEDPPSISSLVDQEVLVRAIKLHRIQRSDLAETSDGVEIVQKPIGLPTSQIPTPTPREVQSTKGSQAWLPAADKGDTPKVSYTANCFLNCLKSCQGIGRFIKF